MLTQVFAPCFRRKTFSKQVLCSLSAVQALTGCSRPPGGALWSATTTPASKPAETDSEERPGWVNYWVFSIPTEVQAGQDRVVPPKLRAEVNGEEREEWEEKPAIPSSQPYGLYCCSALNTLPLMVLSDTPVILLLTLFFLPPCFPRGWNRLCEGWYLQKWLVITWWYVILWAWQLSDCSFNCQN